MLKFLDKISEHFQGRVERLKNEREKLKQEKDVLLSRPCSPEAASRMSKINKRLAEIDQILITKAAD